MKSNVCPVCEKGGLIFEKSTSEHTIEGKQISVAHSMHWCDACGLEITTFEDARDNARAMRAAERAAIGKMTGAQIAQMRKGLGITQEIAGRLFGGGPVAFCKYEKDDLAPSDAMDNLLWLVFNKPTAAVELAARHGLSDHLPAHVTPTDIRFEAAAFSVGQRMAATLSSAINDAKHGFMPGVFKMSGVLASNQASVAETISHDELRMVATG